MVHMVVVVLHVVVDLVDNQVHLGLNSGKLDFVLVVVDHSKTSSFGFFVASDWFL